MRSTLLAFLIFSLLTGCGPQKPEAASDQVTLQLKWLPGAQFAGFYVAETQGYYDEENIDLSLLPGGINVPRIDNVVSGQAQFGILSGDQLLTSRIAGQPVKAVAAIFQINPAAFFSLAASGIEKPADMTGKRVGVNPGSLTLPVVLHSAGLTLEDIEPVPLSSDLTPFLEGDADVWAGYVTDQVLTLENQGYDLNVIMAYDYGAFIYSDVLFTTDALIENDPDLVARFVRATLRGWQYTLEHPDEAVDTILQFAPEQSRERTRAEILATIPLITTPRAELGLMDSLVWETTQHIALDNGLIDTPIDLASLYTNRFAQAWERP